MSPPPTTEATMKAIRIQPSPTPAPYSASNPAPPSALTLDEAAPLPILTKPNHILVRVRAATVTRDELTWPESYTHPSRIPGYDLAGIVAQVHPDATDPNEKLRFRPGDEVFAFADLHAGAAWAEYAAVDAALLARKPNALSFEEAATVPMSALTAWQALFVHSGVDEPDFEHQKGEGVGSGREVYVTGASGAVGSWVVQLAAAAGLRVVAASSSNERNGEFLRALGASEVVEYGEVVKSGRTFGTIVDTVGGKPLKQCWSLVADKGSIVTVDSSSFEFGEKDAPAGKEGVKAKFFILEPSGKHLEGIARGLELGVLKAHVAYTFPLGEARAAYEKASGRLDRRGKVVLTI